MKAFKEREIISQRNGDDSPQDCLRGNMGTIGRQFNAGCDALPPRRPARKRSTKLQSPNCRAVGGLDHTSIQFNGGFLGGNDQCDTIDNRNCSTTMDETSVSAPCSSIYCYETNDSVYGTSIHSILAQNRVRDFMENYNEVYGTMLGPQTIESWRDFADKFYTPTFQFLRPSGNPMSRDAFVRSLALDVNFSRVQMISIDSVVILSCGRAAVVIYTVEHYFAFKGISNEDRAVMSCVLELADGEIKIVHEHRTSSMPIPKASRWNPE